MSINTLAKATTNQVNSQQKQYLGFALDEEINALIALAELGGIINILQKDIVAVPDLPAWALGLYNWRGDIVWVIDLGQMLQFRPLNSRKNNLDKSAVLVIKAGKNYLGLAVDQVNELYWCDPAEVESPPTVDIAQLLLPILKGLVLNPEGTILWVVDPTAIALLAAQKSQ